MNKVFILGHNGYVGSHLSDFLSAQFSVVTVGRTNSEIILDLETGEYTSLLNRVSQGDAIVFLSAISAPDECEKNYQYAYKINVERTTELISLLLNKNVKVIFSSSDVVFGNSNAICDEHSELQPFGKYGAMKASVEESFRHNPNFFAIRFSYILGRADKFSEMIKSFNSQNKELDVFDGFERSVISINDVLLGIKNILLKWDKINTRVINFSGPELVSRQSIVLAYAKEKYQNLKYKFTEAPESFWLGRPKKINTKSIYLESVLDTKCESYIDVIKE